MRRFILPLAFVLAGSLPAAAQERPPATPIVIAPGDASSCVLEVARGEYEAALPTCRKAAERGSDDPRVLDALARAELERGDPARAAQVWRGLMDSRGWRWGWALGLAKALWREERPADAERVLREAVRRDPSPEPRRELVAFLLSFSRWDDAAKAAREALERFPGDCSLHEALGVAEAGLGNDAVAASEIGKALEGGCPPLRWIKRGEIPHRIHRPEYRSLLRPELLAKGLASLPEGDALEHLRLLELVPDPSLAPAVGDAILHSPSAPVRLAALHLLRRLGPKGLPQWRRILTSPDIMLRKHALRMLARSDEAWLLPVLEERLEEEKAPHNLSLVRIAVARRIAARDPGRARDLLQAVPQDDPSHPLAQELLRSMAEEPRSPSD